MSRIQATYGVIGVCIVAAVVVFAIIGTRATPSPMVSVPPTTPETTPLPPPPVAPIVTPEISIDERIYLAQIISHAEGVGNIMNDIIIFSLNPRFGDVEWTLNMAFEYKVFHELCGEARLIEAPDSMLYIHRIYIRAMEHYQAASSCVIYGLDSSDADLINAAVPHMEKGNLLINQATRLIEEIGNN